MGRTGYVTTRKRNPCPVGRKYVSETQRRIALGLDVSDRSQQSTTIPSIKESGSSSSEQDSFLISDGEGDRLTKIRHQRIRTRQISDIMGGDVNPFTSVVPKFEPNINYDDDMDISNGEEMLVENNSIGSTFDPRRSLECEDSDQSAMKTTDMFLGEAEMSLDKAADDNISTTMENETYTVELPPLIYFHQSLGDRVSNQSAVNKANVFSKEISHDFMTTENVSNTMGHRSLSSSSHSLGDNISDLSMFDVEHSHPISPPKSRRNRVLHKSAMPTNEIPPDEVSYDGTFTAIEHPPMASPRHSLGRRTPDLSMFHAIHDEYCTRSNKSSKITKKSFRQEDSVIEEDDDADDHDKKGRTMILRPRPLLVPKTPPPGVRRSTRIRIAPVRSWLGEKPIYEKTPRGGLRLCGTSRVEIKDPKQIKFKTANPFKMFAMEHKKKKK